MAKIDVQGKIAGGKKFGREAIAKTLGLGAIGIIAGYIADEDFADLEKKVVRNPVIMVGDEIDKVLKSDGKKIHADPVNKTIILQNEIFIKWKLTITYTIIGIIFIKNSHKKNLITQKIGKNLIKLPKKIWMHLNYIWGIYFFFIAITNIYISYKFNIKIWIYFKIFGITMSIIVFLIIQIFYIKYIYKK